MCTKWLKIRYIIVLFTSQTAGQLTPGVWKMLIIPPALATALHHGSHMLLYKPFTYNGIHYWAATRLFRIRIKRLDFRPPQAKERICVDTTGPRLTHYLLCLAGPRRKGCLCRRRYKSEKTGQLRAFCEYASRWTTSRIIMIGRQTVKIKTFVLSYFYFVIHTLQFL